MKDSKAGAAKRVELRAALGMLDPSDSSAQSISRLQKITQLQDTLSSLAAEETVEAETHRYNEETDRGVPVARQGNGLAAEIGLARGQSPARGTKCLQVAGALVYEMPNTMAALSLGQISEEHAQAVVKETAWLSPEHRAEVDTFIAGKFEGLGPRKLADSVRAHAQRLDQHGAVARNEKARSERSVSVRPAADGMAYFTALLTTQQAVGMYATLDRAATSTVSSGNASDPADPTGLPRTPAQIMADTLVERTTGQTSAPSVAAEVQLVMTDAALFGKGDTPAVLTGHGPIPAELAREWIATPEAEIFLRRIFTRPQDHQVVGMESRRRNFPKALRRMVRLRDNRCRTPHCDAPIKEIDHAAPVRNGGPTSWANASGLCAACNQIKENTGWTHQATPERLTVTTPTGHQYAKNTGPVLEGIPPDKRQPPDKQPLPEVRLSTECYATATTQWTATLRIAA